MRKRLIALLEELEDINAIIQNGCIDPLNLACFDGYETEDHERLMSEADRLTGDAFSAIDDLSAMMKENNE